MKIFSKVLTLALAAGFANAATIAIIDSGTDMLHERITPKAWTNYVEIPGNDRDEDRNGYQDDIHGWNFAESNNQVIDYSYLGMLNQDITKFFELQEKSMRGTVTDEELEWMKSKIADAEFLKKLQVYGNFMHGTHVAGISAEKSADAKIMAVKLIPTEVKLPGQQLSGSIGEVIAKGILDGIIKKGIDELAKAQTQMFVEIAHYVDGHGARVANGSFGTGYPQAKMLVETLIKAVTKKEVNEETVEKYAKYFVQALVDRSEAMLAVAPNTLFVFAAGNDGINNDIYPTSPTNIQGPNEISVAATMDYGQLAPFSNYGEKMVDIAAPGVGIYSSVPGHKYLTVSGTSQAAPFVAGVAGLIIDINPELSSSEVKEILMGTVDKKGFLKGKVKSSGVVNTDRAIRAANLSLTMAVHKAVATSIIDVEDIQDDRSSMKRRLPKFVKGSVLPLPSNFVIAE